MLHRLKRHPLPVKAFFRHSLVLTYAFPHDLLAPLLPPGLTVDRFTINAEDNSTAPRSNGDFGFVAVAMVQTQALRPAFLPAVLGKNFFLTGYRIFARYTTKAGRKLRGLRILRSDTDSRMMVTAGNALTHYRYRKADVKLQEDAGKLSIAISTPNNEADLNVRVDLTATVESPPHASPFRTLQQARKFAGPMPFTFDYEEQTHSLILIEGVRRHWHPKPVLVEHADVAFLSQPQFQGVKPVLANAFHVQDIDYMWKRGVREQLSEEVS